MAWMHSEDTPRLIAQMKATSANIFDALEYVARTGNWFDADIDPSEPERTDAMPGTEEKIAVMRQRVDDGEHLFSEWDAPYGTAD